jgi:hypothetical protein
MVWFLYEHFCEYKPESIYYNSGFIYIYAFSLKTAISKELLNIYKEVLKVGLAYWQFHVENTFSCVFESVDQ